MTAIQYIENESTDGYRVKLVTFDDNDNETVLDSDVLESIENLEVLDMNQVKHESIGTIHLVRYS